MTWACEEGKTECEAGTETKWSRNIPGIDGALGAIQMSSGSTTLELHDLQGNIVATAGDKESETKLLSTYDSTEFGVPNEGKTPPKYAWLGAGGLASETAFGTGTITRAGAAYVPQVARNLQTAPVVPPGAFPDGSGTGSHYDSVIPGWSVALANQESANTIAEYAAEQAVLKKQAEEEAAATAQRIHEEEQIPNPNEGGAEEEGEYTFDPTVGNCNMEVGIGYSDDVITFSDHWECRRYDKAKHQYVNIYVELYGYNVFGLAQTEPFKASGGWTGWAFPEPLLDFDPDIPFSEAGVFKVCLKNPGARWGSLSCFKAPVPPELLGPPPEE